MATVRQREGGAKRKREEREQKEGEGGRKQKGEERHQRREK